MAGTLVLRNVAVTIELYQTQYIKKDDFFQETDCELHLDQLCQKWAPVPFKSIPTIKYVCIKTRTKVSKI